MVFRRVPRIDELTDVVWVQTAFLGDIVLTTAAMAALREARPGIRQRLVTTPIGVAALKGHPWLTSLHAFDKRGGGAWRASRAVAREVRNQLDSSSRAVTLQPHRSLRSTILAQMIGLPTVTYGETSLRFLADARVDRVAVLHEAHRVALLGEPLGIARDRLLASRPWMPEASLPNAEWAPAFAASIQAGPVVGLAPGSVWGTKRWPVESFANLAGALLGETKARIVILGSPDERVLADRIESAHRGDRVLNLAGRTSLSDLRAVYPRLSLLVSNDSSPIHYASAFNVATVALFGATTPAMGFGPLADRSVTLGVDGLECRPCSDHGPAVCPLGHFKCMRDLAVERVVEACRSRIQ